MKSTGISTQKNKYIATMIISHVIIISILVLLNIVFLVTLIFSIRKISIYEQKIVEMFRYIVQTSESISEAVQYMKKIDSRGIFEADDEVGLVFTRLAAIVSSLENATIIYETETTKRQDKKEKAHETGQGKE